MHFFNSNTFSAFCFSSIPLCTDNNYKLTKEFKLNYQLNSIQEEILVGILLGDASLERGKSTYNTRLRIEQSLESHKAYLYFLYSFFIDMTKTPPASPSRNPDKRTGKVYNSIKFQTLSFPCLNKFYELFYNNSIKIVPVNIAELLTARSLAF